MASDLEFTVGANTRPIREELGKAEILMEEFGTKVSKKLANSFGVGFLAAKSVGLITAAFGKAEEIEKAAKTYKMTTDEVQMLTIAAEEAGQTLSEYMEDAKRGAVDLSKTLREMRQRGDLNIIPSSDVKTLAEDKRRIARFQSGAVNKTAILMGSVLGMAENSIPFHGSAGKFAAHLLRTTQFMPLPFPLNVGAQFLAKHATKKLNPESATPRADGWMPLPWDPGFVISRAILQNRLNGLEEQENALGKKSLVSLHRTDWQQIGAAVSRPDIVAEAGNETLSQIRDDMSEIRRMLASLPK